MVHPRDAADYEHTLEMMLGSNAALASSPMVFGKRLRRSARVHFGLAIGIALYLAGVDGW